MTAIFVQAAVGLVVVVSWVPFFKNEVLINSKFVMTLFVRGNA